MEEAGQELVNLLESMASVEGSNIECCSISSRNCYNHSRLPHYAYLKRRTSHFFMPTIFVIHLMLDSYGQPHFLTYTVPCLLPLFYIWFLPYYEYGTIPCSLIRTSLCTYMYISPCT